jgi:GntR family transcriptional regulator
MEPTLPVYQQIRRYIKHAVLDKVYEANNQIPTEKELAEQFKVNRITIRQAISSLVDEGLLIRSRGKGTFVTHDEKLIQKMSLKNVGMVSDLLPPLGDSKTLSVELQEVEPGTIIREKLELGEDENKVIKVIRDRIVPEGSKVYTVNYLPYDIGKNLTTGELKKRPLLDILENDFQVDLSEAFQTIEASFADAETAGHLGIMPGNQILFIERIMYNEQRRPVELVRNSYEANLYKCCLSIKKTKQDSNYNWVCQITK